VGSLAIPAYHSIIWSRHGYRDRKAAVRPGLGGNGAAMCGGDRRDDRQAEAEAVAGGTALQPLEGLEQDA